MPPTPLVVVTFLAVLELYKRSMVRVEQSRLFGDIDIEYIEGSGEIFAGWRRRADVGWGGIDVRGT